MMDLNEIPFSNDQMLNKVTNLDYNFNGISQNSGKKASRVIEEKGVALDFEGVKGRIRVLEAENLGIEEEIEGFKDKKVILEGTGMGETSCGTEFSFDVWKVDDDGESGVDQLMIENKVLECEKMYALKEVETWKRKFGDLELRVLELEGRLRSHGIDCVPVKSKEAEEDSSNDANASRNGEMRIEGTPCIGSPQLVEDTPTTRLQPATKVRRQLAFENESSCDRKIAPPTPASGNLINIVDSDDEHDIPAVQSKGTSCGSPGLGFGGTDVIMDQVDKAGCKGNLPFVGTPKRKRVFTSDDENEVEETLPRKRTFRIDKSDDEGEDDNIIAVIKQAFSNGNTENESDDDDDNVPISQLMMNHARFSNQGVGLCSKSNSVPQAHNAVSPTRPRRRLVKSEQNKKKGGLQENEINCGNLASENGEGDKQEEDGSDRDDDSMGGFIVNDDEEEDVEDDVEDDVWEEDSNDDSHKLQNLSDDNVDFKEIISRLQRRKNPNSKWELEGDMLSAFGKDPLSCMKAVCALYRQQTSTEKLCKESMIQNGRGFSKFDAARGTRLGEFLTGGDPNGDLVKSVEDLRDHDPDGPDICLTLAKHYSMQLFKIYKNEEDPFFCESSLLVGEFS